MLNLVRGNGVTRAGRWRRIGLPALLAFVLGSAVGWQIDPASIIQLPDAAVLALTADGFTLLAVGDDGEASFFNLRNPARPAALNQVMLEGVPDGVPVAAAFAGSAALVAVDIPDESDLLQVLARPSYNPNQYVLYAFYDIVGEPLGIAVAPSLEWAVVYGAQGYTLIQLVSLDEFNSITQSTAPLRDVAVSDEYLLLVEENGALSRIPLLIGAQSAGETLPYEGVEAIALSPDGALGALVAGNQLVTFDTASLQTVASTPLEETFTELALLNDRGVPVVVVTGEGSTRTFALSGNTLTERVAPEATSTIFAAGGRLAALASDDAIAIFRP